MVLKGKRKNRFHYLLMDMLMIEFSAVNLRLLPFL
jgi:hypothetical protein